jgi:hypothetical protein
MALILRETSEKTHRDKLTTARITIVLINQRHRILNLNKFNRNLSLIKIPICSSLIIAKSIPLSWIKFLKICNSPILNKPFPNQHQRKSRRPMVIQLHKLLVIMKSYLKAVLLLSHQSTIMCIKIGTNYQYYDSKLTSTTLTTLISASFTSLMISINNSICAKLSKVLIVYKNRKIVKYLKKYLQGALWSTRLVLIRVKQLQLKWEVNLSKIMI